MEQRGRPSPLDSGAIEHSSPDPDDLSPVQGPPDVSSDPIGNLPGKPTGDTSRQPESSTGGEGGAAEQQGAPDTLG